MRIGILTYHRAYNYGALLQGFALKAYIETFGHEVEFIDYWPNYHNNIYKYIPNFWISSPTTNLRSIVKLLLGLRRSILRHKGYKKFIHSLLNVPKRVRHNSIDSLSNLHYDLIIYGSDQIWRKQDTPAFKGFDVVYFGQHISASKKITYAASMGIIENTESDKKDISSMLSNFDNISVREKELKYLVEQTVNINPKLVLDPVFLLNKEEWDSIIPTSKSKSYILFYHLMPSEQAEEVVDQLEQLLSLKVYEIQKKINPLKVGERFKYQAASPTKFLELLKNANFIVSSSFHGVALSIIFKKQFFAVGMKDNSGRVKTLLSELGIENRYIESCENLDILTNIDYNDIYQRLDSLKENSKQFLLPFISE